MLEPIPHGNAWNRGRALLFVDAACNEDPGTMHYQNDAAHSCKPERLTINLRKLREAGSIDPRVRGAEPKPQLPQAAG